MVDAGRLPPAAGSYVLQMARHLSLIEFPADDPGRAKRFWSELLGSPLKPRSDGQGEGWQTADEGTAVGVHERGRGPGDSFSLPYLAVSDIDAALEQVVALGGSVVHPGAQWAICKDSEGSPFALALEAVADATDAAGRS
jgi:predicted enzyme related to lactoylglutathione lyase